MLHESIHVRIGEFLKIYQEREGQPAPKTLVNIVASTHEDWEKRLRELRELGWRYRVIKKKEGSRVRTYYQLVHWEPWPSDPAAAIREAEHRKGVR